MVAVVGGVLAVFLMFLTVDEPRFDCNPGPRLEEKITGYRTVTFGIATAVAIALGGIASVWSQTRRERAGLASRPGVPTICAVAVTPIMLAIALFDPDNAPTFYFFFYAGVAGLGVVPVLALAALVIAIAGDRWTLSAPGASRVEAATIVIADGLVFFGLAFAILAAYLQTFDLCLN